jgi:cytochrome b561
MAETMTGWAAAAYTVTARVLHWLTAVPVLGMITG